MENVKILIVENELLIAESLRIMLEDMGYEVPAIFTKGISVLENFKPGFADIIIMDIHLGDNINGVDASIEIRKISTAPIIYITDNKDEYLRKKAIYETNAIQYITKPFTNTEVAIAIDLAIKAVKKHELISQEANRTSYLIDDCIYVKDAQGFKKIMISDILFLKAEGSYCYLFFNETQSGKSKTQGILYSENLSFLEEQLSFAKSLVRIHRSYIVNINNVNKIQENRLWIGETEIPIGKTYKHEIRGRFRFI